jgi:uncharacterized repeat protein (TIGR01451 family)
MTWHTSAVASAANLYTGDLSVAPEGTYYLAFHQTIEDCYSLTTKVIIKKVCADLSIVITVNKETPAVGSNVIFTLKAKNLGPSNATGVSVTDLLPAGYTYVSNTTPAVGSFDNGTGIWTIGNLMAGAAEETITITAKVNATGPYLNTATISGNESDPEPDNNSSEVSTTAHSLFITNPMIYQRIIIKN